MLIEFDHMRRRHYIVFLKEDSFCPLTIWAVGFGENNDCTVEHEVSVTLL